MRNFMIFTEKGNDGSKEVCHSWIQLFIKIIRYLRNGNEIIIDVKELRK